MRSEIPSYAHNTSIELTIPPRRRLISKRLVCRRQTTITKALCDLLYRGLYGCLGSYELACVKWDFDIAGYYNQWVSAYVCDQHLDAEYLKLQLRLEPFVLRALDDFGRAFRRIETRLHQDGTYFRSNVGKFYHGLSHVDFVERVGMPRSHEEVVEKAGEIFNMVRGQTLELLGEAPAGGKVEPLPLAAFLTGRAFT